jgi:hypothetical protein
MPVLAVKALFRRLGDVLISRTLTNKQQRGEDQSPKSEMSNSIESRYLRLEGKTPALLILDDVQSTLIHAELELPIESEPVTSFPSHTSKPASRSVFVSARPPKKGDNVQNMGDDG